ncbi:MAG: RES domain-containing protein [Elusimicrobiota bacterium]
MPQEEKIRGAVGAVEITKIDGSVYFRSIPKVFKGTPLEWTPSFQDGNRYNQKNLFAALYFAGSVFLAEKEVEARLRPEYQESRLTLGFRVQIDKAIDLTAPNNLALLEKAGVYRDDLIKPAGADESGYKMTRLIGKFAYELGIKALIVPTSKPKPQDMQDEVWHNLVIFPVPLMAPFLIPVYE